MNTRKIIAAAVAVLITLMPVVVQARHTEDTYYNKYSEGQVLGSLTYSGGTFSVLYGVSQETIDTGNVELFGLSSADHLIMLAHSDKAFSKLYDYSEIGVKINVILNNNSVWYEIISAYWIDQTTWESEQNLYNFYYTDNTPLTLVTCNHRSGVRGRWIVQCTYSDAPVPENFENVVVEDTFICNEIEISEEPETVEIVETVETSEQESKMVETVEEEKENSITTLNSLKMKKTYVADFVRLYRGF